MPINQGHYHVDFQRFHHQFINTHPPDTRVSVIWIIKRKLLICNNAFQFQFQTTHLTPPSDNIEYWHFCYPLSILPPHVTKGGFLDYLKKKHNNIHQMFIWIQISMSDNHTTLWWSLRSIALWVMTTLKISAHSSPNYLSMNYQTHRIDKFGFHHCKTIQPWFLLLTSKMK